jgi:hypothetical protein
MMAAGSDSSGLGGEGLGSLEGRTSERPSRESESTASLGKFFDSFGWNFSPGNFPLEEYDFLDSKPPADVPRIIIAYGFWNGIYHLFQEVFSDPEKMRFYLENPGLIRLVLVGDSQEEVDESLRIINLSQGGSFSKDERCFLANDNLLKALRSSPEHYREIASKCWPFLKAFTEQSGNPGFMLKRSVFPEKFGDSLIFCRQGLKGLLNHLSESNYNESNSEYTLVGMALGSLVDREVSKIQSESEDIEGCLKDRLESITEYLE